jgi:PAS domain S-box-containing protein
MEVGGGRMFVFLRDITEHKRAEEAFRSSEESAKKLAQENVVMAEIGQIISSTLNINEVYERFAEEAHKLIPFDRIMINLADLKNDTSTTAYIAGIDVPGRQAGDITSMAGTVTEEVIRTRSRLLIQVDNDNIDEVARRFPSLSPTFQAGLRSLIFVPLISKDQVIGVLSLRALVPKAYTDQDVRLTESIGNQIAGAIANAQLFIEHQRTEEALRVSEDRYRDLVEHSQDMICIHDLEGWIISINQAATKLLGYEQNELLKINFKDILAPAPEVRDQFEMYMTELKRDGFSKGLMLVQTKKGETRIWEYNSSLRTEGISSPVVRGMAHDITDRKRTEEEREKLILQLQKALAEVKQLSGLLPICASCKKIRDDKGYWNQIESYIRDHSEAEFSHGICPECMKKLYPGFDESVKQS